MDIETQLLREYKDFIYAKSIFSSEVKILPSTPQSFSVYPTIIFSEVNNVDYTLGKTLERSETVDNLSYQVDIYTKDIKIERTIEGQKVVDTYAARTVVNELKDLTFKFFNNAGFERINALRGEYIDVTVQRYTMLFNAKLNSWNMKISS